LLCTSPFRVLNIASCCCVPHFFEFMCCFKLLVTTFSSSLWTFEVVGCCYAFHFLEFLLKLLIIVVHFTSLFLSLGFLVFTSKELYILFLNTMYKGRKGWGENILCGWESGKEVGSRHKDSKRHWNK
jgi:hypothetical protein